MDPSRTRLTIVLPFHHDVELLEVALASVRAQTCAAWSAIVVDNAPHDVGAGRVSQATGDRRIACVRNDVSLSIGQNWNRCLDLARTELVTLLHSDDRLHPGFAKRMLDAADEVPEAAAYFCRARPVDRTGLPLPSAADRYKRLLTPLPDPATGRFILRGEPAVRRLMRGNFIVCPTLCYRTARLAGHRFSTRWRFMLDLDFTTRLLMAGEVLVGLSDVALDYRLHEASQTSELNRTRYRFEEEAAFLREMAGLLDARGWHRAAGVARRMGVTKLHLGFQAAADLAGLRFGACRAKVGLLGKLLAGRLAPGAR